MAKKEKFFAGALSAALAMMGISAAQANAAPVGAFSDISFVKVADGYQFTNNPVDDVNNNNIVAVNDFVGFRIQGNTETAAVSDATLTLTKPSCFAWETSSVDTALNFNLDGGASTGTLTKPDADTLTVTWDQAASGVVLTQPFRARATQACADGTVWNPVLTVTDAAGTRNLALDPITVRSVPKADISISAVGSPKQVNRWFQNPSGVIPAYQQTWQVRLSPETLAAVGYADPNGTISFTVSFASDIPGVTSAFEFPNHATTVTGCWSYSPRKESVFNARLTQTHTFTMSTKPECVALLAGTNTLLIDSFTPDQYIPEGATVNLSATVNAGDWTDVDGRQIPDANPNNNVATVQIVKQAPVYGYLQGMAIFTPKVPDADYTKAYPQRVSGNQPTVADYNADTFAVVTGSKVGFNAEFTGEAFYSYEEPKLNNIAAYQFWDPAKQQLNLEKLDAAVLGQVAPSNSAAAANPNTMGSRAMPADTYTKLCTTDYTGANSATAATMTWADCATLDPAQISGIKFFRAGEYTGAIYPGYAPEKHLFTQVPFKAVADAGVTTSTLSRWEADQWTANRERSAQVTIIGNELFLEKTGVVYLVDENGNPVLGADGTPQTSQQIQPEGTATYTLTPAIGQPAGSFLPAEVPNLRLVDTLDWGLEKVDFVNLDPFWKVEIVPADLGPDGIPYTADDVSRMQLIFTPADPTAVTTETQLPKITYEAKQSILLPPVAAPYNATVTNTATLSADQSAGDATDKASLAAGSPEAAFFRKMLVSPQLIEVEDEPTAWRVEWINYNNYELGQARFVDVFPYNGDGVQGAERFSDFAGTSELAAIDLRGSATVPGVVVELTTDAPETITASPAANTNWVEVDPKDSASWPDNATAIRLTLPKVAPSTQGYGSMTLHFDVSGQEAGDVYDNNASATIFDPNQNRTMNLGTREADEVRVVASEISGVAWVDANRDGVRQSDEALLPKVKVNLYRGDDLTTPVRTTVTDSQGAYSFQQLHSSDGVLTEIDQRGGETPYTVIFAADDLRLRGYEITTQLIGDDKAIDSDAEQQTGAVAAVSLPIDAAIPNLDAGVYVLPPTADITAVGTVHTEHQWKIEKTAQDAAEIIVNPETGLAEINYEVTTTELNPVHQAEVTGEIKVHNPATTAVYVVSGTVTSEDSGLTCALTGAQSIDLQPGATEVLEYSCTGTPSALEKNLVKADISFTNKVIDAATVANAKPEAELVYERTESQVTVNVVDTLQVPGKDEVIRNFGPYERAGAGTVHSETYTETVTVPVGECLDVVNRAELAELGLTAETATKLCLEKPKEPVPPVDPPTPPSPPTKPVTPANPTEPNTPTPPTPPLNPPAKPEVPATPVAPAASPKLAVTGAEIPGLAMVLLGFLVLGAVALRRAEK